LDDVAPSVRFATLDSGDPTRIDVFAADAASGLGRAEIEVRRRSDARWLPIPASRVSYGFVGRFDDEHLANGVYDLRARVFDNAGNERSTTIDTYGHGATRAVPARIDTRLSAGHKTRTVGYGKATRIDGRVTMAGSNPVANATVEVWEHVSVHDSVWRRIALINADSGGRFTFNASRGPSRHLRFRYPGTPLVRARTTEIAIDVKAMTRFRTNRQRVVNGEEIVLGGKVLGGPLPRVGKIVQLQAYSRGRWITFATPRASARTGRWKYRYRFTSTRGTVRYRFRARVPRESGFPYAAGVSRQARVIVRGL
jgi:hypothetical protein